MCKVNEQPVFITTQKIGSQQYQVSFTLQPQEVQKETTCTHTFETSIWHIYIYIIPYLVGQFYCMKIELLFQRMSLCHWTIVIFYFKYVISLYVTMNIHLTPVPPKAHLARSWGDQQLCVLCSAPPLCISWKQQWINTPILLLFTLCKHNYLSPQQRKIFRLH